MTSGALRRHADEGCRRFDPRAVRIPPRPTTTPVRPIRLDERDGATAKSGAGQPRTRASGLFDGKIDERIELRRRHLIQISQAGVRVHHQPTGPARDRRSANASARLSRSPVLGDHVRGAPHVDRDRAPPRPRPAARRRRHAALEPKRALLEGRDHPLAGGAAIVIGAGRQAPGARRCRTRESLRSSGSARRGCRASGSQ